LFGLSLLSRQTIGELEPFDAAYAIRDLRNVVAAGRYHVEDPELAWRLATHAIVGFSVAVCDGKLRAEKIDDAVVDLLGMVGVPREEAREIARRPSPELPGE
jgi:hypothetical protein